MLQEILDDKEIVNFQNKGMYSTFTDSKNISYAWQHKTNLLCRFVPDKEVFLSSEELFDKSIRLSILETKNLLKHLQFEQEIVCLVGRYQPLHSGHLSVLNAALNTGKTVVMFICSTQEARTTKNPFTFTERVEMILKSVPEHCQSSLRFVSVPDYLLDSVWSSHIEEEIRSRAMSATIFVSDKDKLTADSNNLFKGKVGLALERVPTVEGIHATQIRTALIQSDGMEKPEHISEGSFQVVQNLLKIDPNLFKNLKKQ